MDCIVMIVDHPASTAMTRESVTPRARPMRPPTTADHDGFDQELPDDVGLLRPHGPPDANLARALQHAGQHDVHDADPANQEGNRRKRHHDESEDPLGALLFGEQLRRHDQRVVVGGAVCRVQDAADDAGGTEHVRRGRHLQVDAIDVVLEPAVAVLQTQERRTHRHVDDVVPILRRNAGHVGLGAELRAHGPDHAEPLFVDLHPLADGIARAEERRSGGFAEHAHRLCIPGVGRRR